MSFTDQDEATSCGHLALWFLHENGSWWCLDLQVSPFLYGIWKCLDHVEVPGLLLGGLVCLTGLLVGLTAEHLCGGLLL